MRVLQTNLALLLAPNPEIWRKSELIISGYTSFGEYISVLDASNLQLLQCITADKGALVSNVVHVSLQGKAVQSRLASWNFILLIALKLWMAIAGATGAWECWLQLHDDLEQEFLRYVLDGIAFLNRLEVDWVADRAPQLRSWITCLSGKEIHSYFRLSTHCTHRRPQSNILT